MSQLATLTIMTARGAAPRTVSKLISGTCSTRTSRQSLLSCLTPSLGQPRTSYSRQYSQPPKTSKGKINATPNADATAGKTLIVTPSPISNPTNAASGLAAQLLKKEAGVLEEPESEPPSGNKTPGSSKHVPPKSGASNMLPYTFFGGITGAVIYYGRPKTEEESWSPISIVQRTYTRTNDYVESLQQPVFKKLLPDELPAPYQQPYTVVINLDDTLIKSEWDLQTGWRVAKRPGVDYFLAYLAQNYEVVLFTSQPSMNAEPIVQKLDPYESFMYKLYRESCKKIDGKYVKDLSMLNRDLKKVVILDVNPDAYRLQPENAIRLKPWDGSPDDDYLVGMLPFLEALAYSQPADVRPILEFWSAKPNIPLAYAEYEKALREKHIADWREQQEKIRPKKGLGSLFSSPKSAPPSDQPPPHFIDLMRQQTQENFKRHQELVKTQSAEQKEVLKELESKVMKDMNLWKWMTEGTPQISPEMMELEMQKKKMKQQQQQEQEQTPANVAN